MLSYFYVDLVLLQLRATANIARVDEKLVHISTSSLTVVLVVIQLMYEYEPQFHTPIKALHCADSFEERA